MSGFFHSFGGSKGALVQLWFQDTLHFDPCEMTAIRRVLVSCKKLGLPL
jgi:hypothetical protein